MAGATGAHDSFLESFRREMGTEPAAGLDGREVAVRLHGHLRADCERLNAPIKGLNQWASNVEFELEGPRSWTVECCGADAFRLYPAHIGADGQIVWLNVWVRDDMGLDEMIEALTQEFGL
jgi:hypothetical protein